MMSKAELREYNQQLVQRIRYAAYHTPTKLGALPRMLLAHICLAFVEAGNRPIDGSIAALAKATGSSIPVTRKAFNQLGDYIDYWGHGLHGCLSPSKAMMALYGEPNTKVLTDKLPKEEPNWQDPAKEAAAPRQGFVYIMHNKRNGFYKIGFSIKPTYRERTLQAEEPEIEMLGYFAGATYHEKELHNHFGAKRIRGEWFALNQSDLDYILNQV